LLHYLKNKLKIGIPEYTYISGDKSITGYKMLSGQELRPSYFKQLSSSEKEMIGEQIANFLTVLHATPKSIIKKYHVRTEDDWKRYSELVHNTKKLLFPRLSKADIRIVEQYFNELEDLVHKHPNVLVHNDLIWEHILWDRKKRQINIIDFSDRVFGDPAVDFAGLLEYGHRFKERVLTLYEGKKDNRTLHRSQLYFKRISLFLMIAALKGYPCTFKEGYYMFERLFKA
ncbi:MAG: aminoglycoside phosphotransferase family protein, partial [Thermoproteota archaeon]